jgi:hypothetical protein
LSDHVLGVEAGYRFGKTAPEYLESLVVLMEGKHDEDARSVGSKLLRRFDGNDFVGPAETKFFLEAFRHGDGSKHPLGRCIKIVSGVPLLLSILKVGDGSVLGDGKFFRERFGESKSTAE